MATELGKRLRAARKMRGFTQIELARGMGVPQSTISSMENHGKSSSITVDIAEFLRVNPAWLAAGRGPMLNEAPDQNSGAQNDGPIAPAQPDLDVESAVFASIKFFADRIHDTNLREAALARCLNTINVCYLEYQAKRAAAELQESTSAATRGHLANQ